MSITKASSNSKKASGLLSQYLLNGGSNSLVVNGAVTPVPFSYLVPAGQILKCARMLLYLEGSTAFSAANFANISALTNGLMIQVDGVTLENWKDNIDLVTTFYDASGYASLGNQARSISGRWTFERLTENSGALVVNESFIVTVQDDLSSLDAFRIKIQKAQ